MIHKIFPPRVDYLEIVMRVEKPILIKGNEKHIHYELGSFMRGLFGFKEEHKNDYKDLYVFKGRSWEIKKKTQKILLKGEAFFSKKEWFRVQMLVRWLEQNKVDWYLKCLDIRRNFQAKKIEEPFKDLKRGFWIVRASEKAFFQPELYRKHSIKSLGSYFKSEYFQVACYDKSDQIRDLEKSLTKKRIKAETKERYKKIVYSFRREHKDPSQEVKRWELKIRHKEKAEIFNNNLRIYQNEEEFCFSVLSMFYQSHPMKQKDGENKKESRNFKRFFHK